MNEGRVVQTAGVVAERIVDDVETALAMAGERGKTIHEWDSEKADFLDAAKEEDEDGFGAAVAEYLGLSNPRDIDVMDAVGGLVVAALDLDDLAKRLVALQEGR